MDKDIAVQSAALVSGVHLLKYPVNVELVKRWFTEIFEASKSRDAMVQYHALGLMYQLRKHDRLAVTKLLASVKKNVRSPFASCLLIRLIVTLLRETNATNDENAPFYSYLASCLRNTNDLVMYEAARALSTNDLPGLTTKLLSGAIAALQSLLGNPKATLRFAGIRTLNEVALKHTKEVQLCNPDIEGLISDQNRNIATLAVTTLLKTGDVESVDRLIKEISNFMGELSDEFKVILISAVQTLCGKFPQKYRVLIVFLSDILREEGGYTYKKAIIDSILGIMKDVPESKEMALSSLCEFIEDCEFAQLSIQVLDLVGREGPSTSLPSRYIRYIYNRVILETPPIRSAAVQALASFGIRLPALRPSIIKLLKRILHDSDDEVRDRATFFLSLLEKEEGAVSEGVDMGDFATDFPITGEELQSALLDYQHSGFESPFDLESTVSIVLADRPVRLAKESLENQKKQAGSGGGAGFSGGAGAGGKSEAAARVGAIPEFAMYGKVFKSSDPVKLSEDVAEYQVSCIKHMFEKHIVFEFVVTNTVSEEELGDVSVKLESDASCEEELSSLSPDVEIEIKLLPFDAPSSCYVSFERDPEIFNVGTFTATLNYTLYNLDSTGQREDEGDEDDYPLEELDLVVGDYCLKAMAPSFHEEWEKYEEGEAMETFTLNSVKTLQNAVNEILSHLSLFPIDKTNEVPDKKTKHTLFASGCWASGILVLARARMRINPSTQNVDLELIVRSPDEEVNQLLASSV